MFLQILRRLPTLQIHLREKYRTSLLGPRLVNLLAVVIFLSILINIPRFFEISIVSIFRNVTDEQNISTVVEEISYDVTELRMNPDYIRFSPAEYSRNLIIFNFRFYINLTRLISTCIIPLILLIFLNRRIFHGIRFVSFWHLTFRHLKALF